MIRKFGLPLSAVILACFPFTAQALDGVDSSVDPCTDFYHYVNRKWIESTPIPEDRTSWGTFSIVEKRNEATLLAAIEEAQRKLPEEGSAQRKAIDFFQSGMDVAAIAEQGLKPLKPLFETVEAVTDAEGLARAMGFLHARGVKALFTFTVEPDSKNSSRYLAGIKQGGLGLPDRDYYFNEDIPAKTQRQAYISHVARMLVLAGEDATRAELAAKLIVAFESKLAEASMTKVELRDFEKVYNRWSLAQLATHAPGMPWPEYLKSLGAAHVGELDVNQPSFFKAVGELVSQRPLSEWKAYLRWQILHFAASKVHQPFEEENFNFYERILKGRKTPPPRQRHVLGIVASPYGINALGHALGQLYVDRAFPPEAKTRALKLVQNLKAALAQRLREIDWVGEETRARALEKLDAMQIKIGYPDRWRDFSDADIGKYSFVENWMRVNQFDLRRQLRQAGEAVDRSEWWMSPHMVNAYYGFSNNEIVFPAGILQPPFFDVAADDAVNYGAIGAVIGHELTHGFDDQGRKFDARGNLKNWWTVDDSKRYEERAHRIVKQFAAFEGIDGLKINGQRWLGESLSDLGGLKLAYLALKKAHDSKAHVPNSGPTNEQRFFMSYAQVWRTSLRPEQERMRILVGSHPLPRLRVNGSLAHMPEFSRAFRCDASKTLLPEAERANIW